MATNVKLFFFSLYFFKQNVVISAYALILVRDKKLNKKLKKKINGLIEKYNLGKDELLYGP